MCATDRRAGCARAFLVVQEGGETATRPWTLVQHWTALLRK